MRPLGAGLDTWKERAYLSVTSKPILEIRISTLDGKSGTAKAVFDSGSFYTILRADKVPAGANVLPRLASRTLRTAGRGAVLTATAEISLVLGIGDREVDDVALVSPDLSQEMLVGAGTLQKWDISSVDRGGRTEVVVGRHMRDPDVTEVDALAG